MQVKTDIHVVLCIHAYRLIVVVTHADIIDCSVNRLVYIH